MATRIATKKITDSIEGAAWEDTPCWITSITLETTGTREYQFIALRPDELDAVIVFLQEARECYQEGA